GDGGHGNLLLPDYPDSPISTYLRAQVFLSVDRLGSQIRSRTGDRGYRAGTRGADRIGDGGVTDLGPVDLVDVGPGYRIHPVTTGQQAPGENSGQDHDCRTERGGQAHPVDESVFARGDGLAHEVG